MELHNLAYAHKLRYYLLKDTLTTLAEETRISYPFGVISTLLQGDGVVVATAEGKVITVIKSYPM